MITLKLYNAYVDLLENFIDTEDPSECEALDYIAHKVQEYEQKHFPLPEPTIEDELIHLIEQRGLNIDKAIEILNNYKNGESKNK